MNKRQESKLKTRELILEKSSLLIKEKGILCLTTAEIASQCGISHGSLFQHFGNRDTLIHEVLDKELKRIAGRIEAHCTEHSPVEELLEGYLTVISSEEAFFSVLYRELPLLQEAVILHVISLEAIIRNAFFLSLKNSDTFFSDHEISVRLDAFFATVSRLLALKEYYAPKKRTIEARKADLVDLFHTLFRKGGEKNAGKNM